MILSGSRRNLFPYMAVASMIALMGCGKSKSEPQKSSSAKSDSLALKSSEVKSKSPKVAGNGNSKTPGKKSSADIKQPVKKSVAKVKIKKTGKGPVADTIATLKAMGAEVQFNALGEVSHVDFSVVTERKAVSDAQIAMLRHFALSLKILNLTGTGVTNDGMRHLSEFFNLTHLYMHSVTKVDDSGLKHLRNLEKLEEICLDNTNISEDGLQYLQQSSDITRLHISTRNKMTDAALKYILKFTRLKKIRINGTKITKAGKLKIQEAFPRIEFETR